MSLLFVLLEETPGTPNAGMMQIFLLVGVVAVLYFLMIRPQQKKQKELARMRAALGAGDKVLTTGGIYGKIKEVNDTNFIVEIADNVKVKVDKSSVIAANDDPR